jgi:hypothetical protein
MMPTPPPRQPASRWGLLGEDACVVSTGPGTLCLATPARPVTWSCRDGHGGRSRACAGHIAAAAANGRCPTCRSLGADRPITVTPA